MELGKRVAVAAVGIPALLALIWAGGWALGAVLAVAAGLGARELYALAREGSADPFDALGVPGAAAVVLAATLFPSFEASAPWIWGIVLALFLLASASAIWLRGAIRAPLASAAVTLAGAVYAGGTLAHVVFLRHWPEARAAVAGAEAGAWVGGALVVFPILVTWIGDTFAYFAGHGWGRAKLLPSVSPGKTVVGGVAGLAGAVAASVAYGPLVLAPVSGIDAGPLPLAATGLVLGVVAQVGDLAESVVKREAGVKDSGAIFPGHGGVLDRLDSLFFALPAGFWLVVWLDGLA